MKKWIEQTIKNQVGGFSIRPVLEKASAIAAFKLLPQNTWFQIILFVIITVYILIELLKSYDERNARREKSIILNDRERIINDFLRRQNDHD